MCSEKKEKHTRDECMGKVRLEKLGHIEEASTVEELVAGDLLFMMGDIEKEVKLAVKVSNLKNRYDNMKPCAGGQR